MKICSYYLWVSIVMSQKLDNYPNGPPDEQNARLESVNVSPVHARHKEAKRLYGVVFPNGQPEEVGKLTPPLTNVTQVAISQHQETTYSMTTGSSSSTPMLPLETTTTPISSSSSTVSIATPQVTQYSDDIPKIDPTFNYVTQEALPVHDSSHLAFPIIQQIASKGDYRDIFDSRVRSALQDDKRWAALLNDSTSQQSFDGTKYVEAITSKGGRPFLFTGKSQSRTSKNCYVLRAKDTINVVTKAKIREVLEAIGGKIKYSYDLAGMSGFAVCFPDKQLPITFLKSIIGLEWVERDQYARYSQIQESAPWQLARLNDPTMNLSDKMDYSFNVTGSGVNVYVIDSGVMTNHPEFGGRAKIGYSAFANFPEDCAGHGTEVASVIAGTNVGVAKLANIIVMQVLDCEGQGENSSVLSALNWIAKNHIKPAVINMSVGGPKSVSVDEAVQAAVNAGLSVVVAAGNSQIDACALSPSGVEAAMVVGASTYDMKKAIFSNFGSCVEIFAPGSHVVAAAIPSEATTNGYTFVSGTSLSAPLVTGIYALLLQANPNSTPYELKQKIMAAASRGLLDKGTLMGSPNLLATIPILPNNGAANITFLPAGILPYLSPPSSSSTVELVLIIVSASLVPLFLLIILILLWRRRREKKKREAKYASAFH